MSYGKMQQRIDIIKPMQEIDDDGFSNDIEQVLVSVKAHIETKRANEKWKLLTTFANVDTLFRLRLIPNITLDTTMNIRCEDRLYSIVAIEKLRGMYYEIQAKVVIESG